MTEDKVVDSNKNDGKKFEEGQRKKDSKYIGSVNRKEKEHAIRGIPRMDIMYDEIKKLYTFKKRPIRQAKREQKYKSTRELNFKKRPKKTVKIILVNKLKKDIDRLENEWLNLEYCLNKLLALSSNGEQGIDIAYIRGRIEDEKAIVKEDESAKLSFCLDTIDEYSTKQGGQEGEEQSEGPKAQGENKFQFEDLIYRIRQEKTQLERYISCMKYLKYTEELKIRKAELEKQKEELKRRKKELEKKGSEPTLETPTPKNLAGDGIPNETSRFEKELGGRKNETKQPKAEVLG